MECENLPIHKASEPIEEARQPKQTENMPASRKHNVTFQEGTHFDEVSPSQSSSTYKEALSQPPPSLSHRQRLLWLQQRRNTGLWANCDSCGRWRYLPHILDAHELPAKWYCKLNPDKSASSCSVPEAPLRVREEEDLIHAEFSAGSVVWARLPGWPAWPAMVDDCPDTEQFYWLDGFSDIPTHYNVVFFDACDVTRAWIAPENLMPFGRNRKHFKLAQKDKKYKKRLDVAISQADDADSLPLANRLSKYSFLSRYSGTINKPKKVSKKDLQKFQNKLKRKFNVEFDIESASESDADFEPSKKTEVAKKNKAEANRKANKEPEKSKNKKKQKTTKADLNNNVVDKDSCRQFENSKDFKQKEDQTNKKIYENINNDDATALEPVVNEESTGSFVDSNNEGTNTVIEAKDQNSTAIEDSNKAEVQTVEPSAGTNLITDGKEIFKQPADSMVVQVGSTGPTPAAVLTADISVASFDNDTSKTYVPETEMETETETESETISNIKETLKDLRATTASPCSDDFEF